MAERSEWVEAGPEEVAAVLRDGWMYALWVVGTTHIRDVDVEWPRVGSRVHHSVGAWPVRIEDSTRVEEEDLPQRLRLRARGWPLGEAEIVLEVAGVGGGSVVRMWEKPVKGPGMWVNNPVAEWVLGERIEESLSRLKDLVERRRQGPGPAEAGPGGWG